MPTTAAATHDWYTIVSFGWYGPLTVSPPRGPWHGAEAAEEALDRWAARAGQHAGSAMAAMSIRIVGPFCSRAVAQAADISDYPDHLCSHTAA